MSVLLEFSMFPTDHGESKSAYVSRIIKMLQESGVTHQLNPMGTVVETETLDEALGIVKKAYQVLEPDCNRVYSSLKIDIRKGSVGRMKQKLESVEKHLNP